MESPLFYSLSRYIVAISALGILVHLSLWVGGVSHDLSLIPLYITLICGGIPIVYELLRSLLKGQLGADFLAGISIVVSVILGEYLAGAIIVLMISGGEALESYALKRVSSVLENLAKRVPAVSHRREGGEIRDISLSEIKIGDEIVIFPHEIAAVDGEVIEGHSSMDESYLTGEPYVVPKGPGCEVISGAINSESMLVIRATRLAQDSRYSKIMRVMESSRQKRPQFRRIGDMLGGLYTPVALVCALLAWWLSGDASRFLTVLVVATPCPLLIAIPVSIIGAISLSAKRGIIIKDPICLELASTCKIMIFDKTGTLTYGEPRLTACQVAPGFHEEEVLALVASLERYSKHPLSKSIIRAAQDHGVALEEAQEVREEPGRGLIGSVRDRQVQIGSRKHAKAEDQSQIPAQAAGLECVVYLDGRYAALLQFRDEARPNSQRFVEHLASHHHFTGAIMLSGDRESEVAYLAEQVGIKEVYAGKSPEEKVQIVREKTKLTPTIFMGDGINDAPAFYAATVGVAFDPRSDITAEAAAAVILEPSLKKVDEFLHISRHMRAVALQSALGGMALSIGGMGFAAFGLMTPVVGAVFQEVIDLFAVLNALRAAKAPRQLSDIG